MTAIDYEIKCCELYYASLYGGTYHVRFSQPNEKWKADMVEFKTSGFWLNTSKEVGYGTSMLEAVKNLKSLLQSSM